MLQALRIRDFRLLWGGGLVNAFTGGAMQLIGGPLGGILLEVSGSRRHTPGIIEW
jgi:hypothetical protein